MRGSSSRAPGGGIVSALELGKGRSVLRLPSTQRIDSSATWGRRVPVTGRALGRRGPSSERAVGVGAVARAGSHIGHRAR